jgi:hypothetical protein
LEQILDLFSNDFGQPPLMTWAVLILDFYTTIPVRTRWLLWSSEIFVMPKRWLWIIKLVCCQFFTVFPLKLKLSCLHIHIHSHSPVPLASGWGNEKLGPTCQCKIIIQQFQWPVNRQMMNCFWEKNRHRNNDTAESTHRNNDTAESTHRNNDTAESANVANNF